MSEKEAIQLLNSLGGGSSYTATLQGIGTWLAIAMILAIIGGILVYFLFVKSKAKLGNKFLVWLKDFLSFKIMWIEPIVKIFYYFMTIFCVLASFAFISISFVTFITMLVIVPVVLRVGYEAAIMMIMIWRNTKEIADNTKKK